MDATPSGTLLVFLIAFGIALAAWFCLIIYRSTLEAREDDQLFLDPAQNSLAQEQQEVVGRIQKINPLIRSVLTLWIILAIISAGLWVWQGLKSF